MTSRRREPDSRPQGLPGTGHVRAERGSVVPLVVVLLAGALVGVVALGAVAGAAVAARQARTAADLAALSGARAWLDGRPPCAVAAAHARLNGAHVTACDAEPSGAVTVAVEVSLWLPWSGRSRGARAEARAGPAP